MPLNQYFSALYRGPDGFGGSLIEKDIRTNNRGKRQKRLQVNHFFNSFFYSTKFPSDIYYEYTLNAK